MEKLFVLFVVALIANGALCRPQNGNNDQLEERYRQLMEALNQGNFNPWNQPGNFPSRPVRPVPVSSTTLAPTGGTVDSVAITNCIQNCPVTPEYNPVCGTDNVLYPNPGRLQCARDCGRNVSLLRQAPCPAVTPAPAS